jgi:hypothetical protein
MAWSSGGSLRASVGLNVGSATGAGTGDIKASGDLLVTGTMGQEGSWTPTVEGTTGNPTITAYTVRTGFYVRHGRLVHCFGRVVIGTLTVAGTGAIAISGLPFASYTDANIVGNATLSYVANLDNAASMVQVLGYVESNDATPRAVFVESVDNAAPDTNGATRLTSGDHLDFMITYPINI